MDLRLLSAQTHLFCVGGRHAAKTISYNLLICIALGFVAARSHQSLVRWSRVRADVICIIQSALHKCAQVCVCYSSCQSRRAQGAPPQCKGGSPCTFLRQGPPRPASQLEMTVAQRGKRSVPNSLKGPSPSPVKC